MENAKTISDLSGAVPLSDGDLLVVNQPDVFNILTQRNGDTRKVTVEGLADYVITMKQKASVGEYHHLAFQPTPLWLAKNRLLVLNYQIIKIALYQDLCDLMWCGSAANATANFWYKCDADGTRNASGLYMRVLDGRGMFWRGAGANAVFKGANNTPYDGNSIGSVITDAIREIEGDLHDNFTGMNVFPTGVFSVQTGICTLFGGTEAKFGVLSFRASRVVPTSHENRPVSISALTCISY